MSDDDCDDDLDDHMFLGNAKARIIIIIIIIVISQDDDTCGPQCSALHDATVIC